MKMDKPVVFVVTPFSDDFLALFDELKSDFEETYIFINAGDMENQQNILKDITEGIANADIILADLSGLNANVFYELGLAHAMGKKTVIITQDIDELPFDIKSYRAIQYSLQFNKIPDLISELTKLFAGAIDGSIKFGNPVSDFIPNYKISLDEEPKSYDNMDNSNKNLIEEKTYEENDKGIIDYIEEIKADSSSMNTTLNLFVLDMTEMWDSLNKINNEISEAKDKTGNIDPSYVKNLCRKFAEPVNSGADKLKVHIGDIMQYWGRIENNYLGLLDNPFMKQSQNISDLRQSIKSLGELQDAIGRSNNQIKGLITLLQRFRGVERKLNKAINNLIEVLQDYLSMSDTISSSIDRIVNKSNIIIDSILEIQ